MGKLPAFQFYPGDWQKDPALNACDWRARAVWFELLLIMHDAPQRGVLSLVPGQAMTDKQLANLTRIPIADLTESLSELEAAGVFSRDENGVIYSRRMLRDEKRRGEAQKDGQKGGRPKRDDRPEVTDEPVRFDTPTRFPVVEGERQPFGIEREALESGDILRVEAAFLKAWNSTDKTIKVTAISGSRSERDFWQRVSEPGWLETAEKALAVKRSDGGSLRLSKFLDGETPQAILAGNYSFSSAPKAKHGEPVDHTAKAIQQAGKEHQQAEFKRKRLTELEKEYRTQMDLKWVTDVGLLNAERVAYLSEKFPDLRLKELSEMAAEKKATTITRRLYGAAACEALEREDGGLSCAEWCEMKLSQEAK